MRFIHAADIHLDSPMRGLAAYDGAPQEAMRSATRRAFENLVQLALDEQVDFVLIAGDLYDGDWQDYNTGLFFVSQMARLADAAIPVFLIAGNHDAASVLTKQLSLPANCVQLSTKEPETRLLEELGVAIHGQGFATRAVTENLSSAYPGPVDGVLNVGMLHTNADGQPGHDNYAPCKVAELASHGYQYWALGHIHQRGELHTDPWIVFPGNLQGRSIRETGGKGATLVTYEDAAVLAVEHRALDVARWEVCQVDAASAVSADDVLVLSDHALSAAVDAAGRRLLAARVEISGACEAHAAITADPEQLINEVRAQAVNLGTDRVWVEKVKVRTHSPIDLDEVRQREDAIGELLRSIHNLGSEDLAELADEFTDLSSKLPKELREAADPFDPTDPETIRLLVGEVEQLLLPRLTLEDA